ncbi:MAG: ferrous iron transport protein A [Endomicrobium sp.]|nr:ferrous iron transport protein A [Endomicrobium sp.]
MKFKFIHLVQQYIQNLYQTFNRKCYKRFVLIYFRKKVRCFNRCLQCSNQKSIIKLSDVTFGSYTFVTVCGCDNNLENKLLEMGFIPGTELIIINNNGLGGSIIIKIMGTRIAINYNVAKKILVK